MIKYDRKGYKARARQLLLTQNAAVLVEESKVKQQIDYGNLTGKEGKRPFQAKTPPLSL